VLRGVAFCKPFNLIWPPHKKSQARDVTPIFPPLTPFCTPLLAALQTIDDDLRVSKEAVDLFA